MGYFRKLIAILIFKRALTRCLATLLHLGLCNCYYFWKVSAVFSIEGMIRGYYIYQHIWTSQNDEVLLCKREAIQIRRWVGVKVTFSIGKLTHEFTLYIIITKFQVPYSTVGYVSELKILWSKLETLRPEITLSFYMAWQYLVILACPCVDIFWSFCQYWKRLTFFTSSNN